MPLTWPRGPGFSGLNKYNKLDISKWMKSKKIDGKHEGSFLRYIDD
jgi:hypothetical protein